MTAALIVLGLIFVGAILAAGCLVWFCRDHSLDDEERPAHVEGGGLVGDPGPRVEDNFRNWRAW